MPARLLTLLTLCLLALVLLSAGCAQKRPLIRQNELLTAEEQIPPAPGQQLPASAETDITVQVPKEPDADAVPTPQVAGPVGEDAPFDDELLDDDLDFLEEEQSDEESVQAPSMVADPIAPWNRLMFHFNDKLYFWVLKPVALGYRRVVPLPARQGIRNFFYNLAMPVRVVSNILQWRWFNAGVEVGRFVVNTTEGILGFGNPAKRYPELNLPEEDIGQALGNMGINNGFYIYWPFFGPSTLRDTVGLAGDAYLNPVSIFNIVEPEIWFGTKVVDVVNTTSFRIGDYETVKEAALDPYDAIKNGYIQYRNRLIKQ
jgi:phospholipid-binding lipoprotein MlaA